MKGYYFLLIIITIFFLLGSFSVGTLSLGVVNESKAIDVGLDGDSSGASLSQPSNKPEIKSPWWCLWC